MSRLPVTLTRAQIVAGVLAGCQTAEAELCNLIYNTLRPFLYREIGHDAEDRIQDATIEILLAVRANEIQNPECLVGFIRRVGQCKVFRQIEQNMRSRQREVSLEGLRELGWDRPAATTSAFALAADNEMWGLICEVFAELDPIDQKIMMQFYREEQDWPEICQNLGISYGSFRTRKTKAKQVAAVKAKQVFEVTEVAA